MGIDTIIIALLAIVITAYLVRAAKTVRREQGLPNRGSDQKAGYHIIHSEYSSGVSGHQTTYKIPCDPQEYARLFVPQNMDKET